MLSKREIEYLKNIGKFEDNYGMGYAAVIRYRIRKKTKKALHDLQLIFEKDGKRKKAVEYRERRFREVVEKAKKGEADDLDLRVANCLSLLNRDVKAGRRKEEMIILPYQFHNVVRKYLEENPWMARYIEEIIEDLRDREREKARQELLKYYGDYNKDWIKDYVRHHPYKLEDAGFESFDALVEWAESKKVKQFGGV